MEKEREKREEKKLELVSNVLGCFGLGGMIVFVFFLSDFSYVFESIS